MGFQGPYGLGARTARLSSGAYISARALAQTLKFKRRRFEMPMKPPKKSSPEKSLVFGPVFGCAGAGAPAAKHPNHVPPVQCLWWQASEATVASRSPYLR